MIYDLALELLDAYRAAPGSDAPVADSCEGYIQHSEWGLAVEILIEDAGEEGIPLPAPLIAEVRQRFGGLPGVDDWIDKVPVALAA